MINYIIKRLLMIIPVLFGISIITFLAVYFTPGDPAEINLKILLDVDIPPQKAVIELRKEMGLDAPVHIRYFKWLSSVLKGDLGYSFQTKRSTLEEVLSALPATLLLSLTSMLISLVITIPLGILSAIKKNKFTDHFILIGSLIAVSMPDFFIGIVLIIIFAIQLDILPVAGYGSLSNLILPSLTMAIVISSISLRLIRTSMLEVLNESYITMVKSKGLPSKLIIIKHAFKNTLIPVITYLGAQLGYLLGGTVIIESIFLFPGIGKLLVDSIEARDFYVVQGCTLAIALLYVILNIIIDLSYAFIDPRVRYGTEHET